MSEFMMGSVPLNVTERRQTIPMTAEEQRQTVPLTAEPLRPSEGSGGTTDYSRLNNKPSINNVELNGNKSASDLGLAAASDIPDVPVQSVNGKTGNVVLDAEDVGALPDDTVIPTKTSDLTNDSGYRNVNQVNAAIEAALQDYRTSSAQDTIDAGKYEKPSGGIPKTDLASGVQTSLDKADSALQSVPNTYRTAAEQDAIDNGKQAKITALGLLKGDGSGGVSAAVAGTDFQAPLTAGTDYETPAGAKALGLTGASVGDLIRVATVDANGKPTSWNHVPLCDIVTNQNLLDNWDFLNPVNQRGKTAWLNADEYSVDRWKLTSGTASLSASGLTLNGTLVQVREKAIGQPVTCSALLSNGSMINPTYDDSTKTFTITATGQTIKAPKLEIGSKQTLAHQENGVWVLNEVPDYGEELAKCRRFLYAISAGGYQPFGFALVSNATTAYCVFSVSPLRLPRDTDKFETTGSFELWSPTDGTVSATIELAGNTTSTGTFRATAQNLSPGVPYMLRAGSAGATILISAEL